MNLIVHPLSLRMSMAYLLENEWGLYLIDAGIRGEERKILGAVHTIGSKKLRLIYITHAHLDHYGSAAAVQRITGAPVAIHQNDADALAKGETRIGTAHKLGRAIAAMLPLSDLIMRPEPLKADHLLMGDEDLSDFGLAAQVVHTPGHTAGSTSLLVENRLAFCGDLVTNSDRPRLQRYFAQDWSLLAASLKRLQDLRPESVYTGHGMSPIRSAEFLQLKPSG